MAIQPIDLQTLFTQMAKVGKTLVHEKSAITVQQELQTAEFQKRAEMRIRSVNKAQDSGDGIETVKDRKQENKGQPSSQKKNEEDDEQGQEPQEPERIRDPDLGRNIDLSG